MWTIQRTTLCADVQESILAIVLTEDYILPVKEEGGKRKPRLL